MLDPLIQHRGLVTEVDLPTLGLVKQLTTPINVDGELPGATWFEVPGAPTAEVLREIGVDTAGQEQLRDIGAVFEAGEN